MLTNNGLNRIAVITIAVILIVVGIVAVSSYVAGLYLNKTLIEFKDFVGT